MKFEDNPILVTTPNNDIQITIPHPVKNDIHSPTFAILSFGFNILLEINFTILPTMNISPISAYTKANGNPINACLNIFNEKPSIIAIL